jgi:hypothetical protein
MRTYRDALAAKNSDVLVEPLFPFNSDIISMHGGGTQLHRDRY